ncbi:TetR/AcrR family transcriptional regulator [Streptomyces sp. YIM B13518]|uniref:TetR/AcrR family transcriptional regulator n=1 Tax=Streptomyces sp. YIM B13518 TaxID=3366316 RepID=UPI003693C5FA
MSPQDRPLAPREAKTSAARESPLDAARTAPARRPWSAVRRVDAAATTGVSRQTLYDEFGSKDGLAPALVRREPDGYLAGVGRALTGHLDPRDRLTATAGWTTAGARENAPARAMLTGCRGGRLPAPGRTAAASGSAVPAQRRADGPLPSPADFVVLVRDRAVAVLAGPGAPGSDLARSCEPVVHLALSCVTAPPTDGGVTGPVRGVPHRQPVVP